MVDYYMTSIFPSAFHIHLITLGLAGLAAIINLVLFALFYISISTDMSQVGSIEGDRLKIVAGADKSTRKTGKSPVEPGAHASDTAISPAIATLKMP